MRRYLLGHSYPGPGSGGFGRGGWVPSEANIFFLVLFSAIVGLILVRTGKDSSPEVVISGKTQNKRVYRFAERVLLGIIFVSSAWILWLILKNR